MTAEAQRASSGQTAFCEGGEAIGLASMTAYFVGAVLSTA
jgi:hypothetical protein